MTKLTTKTTGLTARQLKVFKAVGSDRDFQIALSLLESVGVNSVTQSSIKGSFSRLMNNGLTRDGIESALKVLSLRGTDVKIGKKTHGNFLDSGWLVLETEGKTYDMQIRSGCVINSNVGDFNLSDKKYDVVTAADAVNALLTELGIV